MLELGLRCVTFHNPHPLYAWNWGSGVIPGELHSWFPSLLWGRLDQWNWGSESGDIPRDGSKLIHQGTAGHSPCFLLSGQAIWGTHPLPTLPHPPELRSSGPPLVNGSGSAWAAAPRPRTFTARTQGLFAIRASLSAVSSRAAQWF